MPLGDRGPALKLETTPHNFAALALCQLDVPQASRSINPPVFWQRRIIRISRSFLAVVGLDVSLIQRRVVPQPLNQVGVGQEGAAKADRICQSAIEVGRASCRERVCSVV